MTPARLPAVTLRPGFWLAAFLVWSGTLYALSSTSPPDRDLPALPGLDKLAHFGWFFGGSGLLSAFLLRRTRRPPTPRREFAVVATLALIGAADEWHQSHVPGRNGNDPADWAADIAGAAAGVLVFRRTCGILNSGTRTTRHPQPEPEPSQ